MNTREGGRMADAAAPVRKRRGRMADAILSLLFRTVCCRQILPAIKAARILSDAGSHNEKGHTFACKHAGVSFFVMCSASQMLS